MRAAMFDRVRFRILVLASLALAFAFAARADDPVSPAAHPTTATVEALSPIARTDGWCFAASTTAVDAMAQAPARVTTAIKRKVRAVEVLHADEDESDSGIDVCAKLGPVGSSDGLTCALDSGTAGLIQSAGQGLAFPIARDLVGGVVMPVWVLAASGTPTVCVGISW